MAWDAARYETYARERSQPLFDLLTRLPEMTPGHILDAGCGTGRTSHVLAKRYPSAEVLGVDASAEMLAAAEPGERVSFVEADLSEWMPKQRFDIVVANAVLHWLPRPRLMLRRLASWVADGGTLAIQVPANFQAPSHRAVRAMIRGRPWRRALRGVALGDHILSLRSYRAVLGRLGFVVEAWDHEYVHELTGARPIGGWLATTTLRPVLDRLDDEAGEGFQRALDERMAQAYPPGPDGVVRFPFRRRFVVASRADIATVGQMALSRSG